MDSSTGRHAAWDTYQSVAIELLPALHHGDADDVVNPRLGGVVIRIRRYGPMWAEDGPMLTAVANSAVRLLRDGNRVALIDLSTAMAHRLFIIAVGPARPPDRDQLGRKSRRNIHRLSDTPSPDRSGRRNTGHIAQQRRGHGPCND
jgi:hypothetical protein